MDSTPENLCDSKIFSYGNLTTLKAVKLGKPVVYLPFQVCYVLESLAIVPESNSVDVAVSLADLVKVVRWEAHCKGIRELYFICREKTTIEFATRHGFEEVLMDEKRGIGLFRMNL